MAQRPHKPLPELNEAQIGRFWSKVDQREADECWPWTAGTFSDPPNNYGSFGLNSRTRLVASRVAFFLATRTDPGEWIVCHSCDNPLRCNPAHLSLGTYADNGQQQRERGRTNRGGARWIKRFRPEPRGHANGTLPAPPASRTPHITYRPLPVLNERGVKKFLAKIERRGSDECWPWKAHVQPSGYGKIRVNYQNWQAHRIAFFLHTGIDPHGLLVCHSCDNRRCCNPAHLSLGTALDNQRQRWERNPQDVSGENSNRAILSWKQVAEIREKYATGKYAQRELGEQYGVSRSCIHSVIRYENWH